MADQRKASEVETKKLKHMNAPDVLGTDSARSFPAYINLSVANN